MLPRLAIHCSRLLIIKTQPWRGKPRPKFLQYHKAKQIKRFFLGPSIFAFVLLGSRNKDAVRYIFLCFSVRQMCAALDERVVRKRIKEILEIIECIGKNGKEERMGNRSFVGYSVHILRRCTLSSWLHHWKSAKVRFDVWESKIWFIEDVFSLHFSFESVHVWMKIDY